MLITRTSVAALIAALALVLSAGGAGGSPTSVRRHTTTGSPRPAVEATNRVALSLLPRLGDGGNVVFSPYSIQAALAMVDQGAEGSTATQLVHVLGAGRAPLGPAEQALVEALKHPTVVATGTPAAELPHLLIANGLWVQSGLGLEPGFQSRLGDDFGAAPQSVNFGTEPEAARQAVNAWVAGHTGQLIKNLMPAGSINAQTLLVLADAIYLKARWANPFVKAATGDHPFFAGAGRPVSVPFMTEPPFEAGYASRPGYRAIDLPYANSTLSMLAVMPAQGSLMRFERHLTPASLARLTGTLRERSVRLQMPKLQLSLHTSLNDALSALGMPVAFSDEADFAGITHAVSLKIDDVEHGAVLKLDEAGTVAAAATGVAVGPTAVLGGPTVELSLDQPYLLFLRDDRSGAILFAARVTDPAAG